MDPRSAYVHIPFCHRRCFYCDFPVVPLGDRADGATSGSVAAYLSLLHQEIATGPGGPPLATVYLGGGTPSMLSSAQVAGILEALARRFGLAPGAELSLELDPASFDEARLAGYLAAGINRVSLGGQSFDDAVLLDLGRRHRGADLREAAGWLRRAYRRGELASWSLDLIQGLPRQDAAHWDGQLSAALALEPPHLSVYDLSIEPGTVFERRLAQGNLALPPEDLAADLMDLTWARLTAAGYGHYEVSNYALPGHASRHNRVYWSGAGWWGFGMGATGAPRGRRRAHPRTRAGYAEALSASLALADAGEGMPFDERLMVGLRRREGVNMERLARQERLETPQLEDLRQRLAAYERRGLLCIEGPRWRLADPAGLALSNGVLREMLAWWEELEQELAPAP
ncbi:radical SAM family heme chaperone HemW [Synechococcus sp. BA-132 BA5]|uniref:radical SAM family heme chaperone HemW n=1 Tax=Synechococcus sp. BA-132 BA5 TaxID=3110252 RepID=UPI002B216C65|nr:radical SAM family heme chaperone HemW [Synechococcus sp. BA-132 BA5]MEA5414783.1 radical SAM family heme chaperone HemW [Synechococcus sp. BA-132 BA5]